jgi:intracellular sulfur oxidation DsrE/DsrF family protein
MMNRVRNVVAALVLAGAACTVQAAEAVKVVYHLSEGVQQASRALGNIRNHLKAEPDTKIVVVTHGDGIEFLLDGARDARGRSFSAPVAELAGRGVQFRVCNNTLAAREIPKEQVLMEATVVDSGVAEVARLQAREGYAYLRP